MGGAEGRHEETTTPWRQERRGRATCEPLVIELQSITMTTRWIGRRRVDTKVINADIPLPLAGTVDQLVARLDRSQGWVVERVLTARVDQEDERRRLTLEGLDDMDAGRVNDDPGPGRKASTATEPRRLRADRYPADSMSATAAARGWRTCSP